MSYLYHYTTFDSAAKILASGCLKFSDIKMLNDINESCGPTVLCDDPRDYPLVEELLNGYSQISLTKDDDEGDRRGFDIPAMWGHYADKGHGACLVLNKEQCIQDTISQKLYSEAVIYQPIESLNDIEYKRSYGDLEWFIIQSQKDLFFHKSSDWKYEQEYRIITRYGSNSFFNIEESLEGVILFSRSQKNFLKSPEYNALSRIRPDLDYYRYNSGMGQFELYNDKGELVFPRQILYDLQNASINDA